MANRGIISRDDPGVTSVGGGPPIPELRVSRPTARPASRVGEQRDVVDRQAAQDQRLRDLTTTSLEAGAAAIRGQTGQNVRLAESQLGGFGLATSPVVVPALTNIVGQGVAQLAQFAAATTVETIRLAYASVEEEVRRLWQTGENEKARDLQLQLQANQIEHIQRLAAQERQTRWYQSIGNFIGKIGLGALSMVPGFQWALPAVIGAGGFGGQRVPLGGGTARA